MLNGLYRQLNVDERKQVVDAVKGKSGALPLNFCFVANSSRPSPSKRATCVHVNPNCWNINLQYWSVFGYSGEAGLDSMCEAFGGLRKCSKPVCWGKSVSGRSTASEKAGPTGNQSFWWVGKAKDADGKARSLRKNECYVPQPQQRCVHTRIHDNMEEINWSVYWFNGPDGFAALCAEQKLWLCSTGCSRDWEDECRSWYMEEQPGGYQAEQSDSSEEAGPDGPGTGESDADGPPSRAHTSEPDDQPQYPDPLFFNDAFTMGRPHQGCEPSGRQRRRQNRRAGNPVPWSRALRFEYRIDPLHPRPFGVRQHPHGFRFSAGDAANPAAAQAAEDLAGLSISDAHQDADPMPAHGSAAGPSSGSAAGPSSGCRAAPSTAGSRVPTLGGAAPWSWADTSLQQDATGTQPSPPAFLFGHQEAAPQGAAAQGPSSPQPACPQQPATPTQAQATADNQLRFVVGSTHDGQAGPRKGRSTRSHQAAEANLA